MPSLTIAAMLLLFWLQVIQGVLTVYSRLRGIEHRGMQGQPKMAVQVCEMFMG